jgi:hypothetical protein
MAKKKYYTSNSKIFSNNLQEIEFNIISELPKIKFDRKNQINTNKNIIDELNKIINNKSKIQIRGIIDTKNPGKIIKEIEKKHQTNKIIKKTPTDDNYDFISAISSQQIIKQIKIQIKDNSKFNSLKNQIYLFTKSNHKDTDIANKSINKKISKQTKIIEDKRLKLKEFRIEKINPVKKILQKCQEKATEFNKKKDKINIEITHENYNDKYSIKEKIKSQIEVLKDKIETNNYKIEHNKQDVKILKEKIKLGVVKEINPILFIATLGLSYYRKSNKLRYKITKILINISNLKQRNLEIEHILKERLRYFNKLDLEYQDNIKKHKEINNSLEEIEKIAQKEELKLDNLKPKENILKEKIENEQEKLEELIKTKLNNDKTSSIEIDKKIEKIEKLFQNQKEIINQIKEKIENQATTIKEELIIEL